MSRPINPIGTHRVLYLSAIVFVLLALPRSHHKWPPAPELYRAKPGVAVDVGANYVPSNFQPEARRAIGRAKTIQCKQELASFVHNLIREPPHLDVEQLGRTFERPQKLGCLNLKWTNETTLVQIDHGHPVDNTFTEECCLQSCFSYGHKYAGHRVSAMACLCGDQSNAENLISGQRSACDAPNELVWYRVNSRDAQLPLHPEASPSAKSNNSIKIAFLLTLNGRSPLQVRRMLRMIYAKEHLYYIHVDKRQQYLYEQLLPLQVNHTNIILTPQRLNTIWGGSSLLRVILEAISSLSYHKWDYLINLSESDLPLKSVDKLEQYLASQSLSRIYLKSHNMTGHKFIKKQGLDQTFYQCENRMWRLGRRRLPGNLSYSGGSDWFALPRNFCDFIIRRRADLKGLVQPLLSFFNYTLLPAESFFHTIALNTEFRQDLVDNNLRLTNWYRKRDCGCQHKEVVDWCGCSPVTYRWSDIKRLQQAKSSDFLFFSRKFDPTISSSVIGAVEHHLVAEQSLDSLQLDTRHWVNVWQSSSKQAAEMPEGFLVQFGLLAITQALSGGTDGDGASLQSLDLYFNRDRFVGVILKFCELSDGQCLELLVARNTTVHLDDYESTCFSPRRQLKVIEVNHSFDIGERTFRNYLPLSSQSSLVVYHEWLLQNRSKGNPKDKLKFLWIGPEGRAKLEQDVKLNAKTDHTQLYLAHKLNLDGQLDSGLWRLSIFDGSTKCLDYRFLIFNESTYARRHLSQDLFIDFYRVTAACSSGDSRWRDCRILDWSLEARDEKLRSYDL